MENNFNQQNNQEVDYIPPRNRRRKKECKYPEFKELCKRRLQEGNPITADEVSDMFKEAFSSFFEQAFQSELEDELGYSKYDYKNSNGKNYRNGSYTKKLKSDIGVNLMLKFQEIEMVIMSLK